MRMQLHLLSPSPRPSYNILLGVEGQQQCAFNRTALLFQTSVVKLCYIALYCDKSPTQRLKIRNLILLSRSRVQENENSSKLFHDKVFSYPNIKKGYLWKKRKKNRFFPVVLRNLNFARVLFRNLFLIRYSAKKYVRTQRHKRVT